MPPKKQCIGRHTSKNARQRKRKAENFVESQSRASQSPRLHNPSSNPVSLNSGHDQSIQDPLQSARLHIPSSNPVFQNSGLNQSIQDPPQREFLRIADAIEDPVSIPIIQFSPPQQRASLRIAERRARDAAVREEPIININEMPNILINFNWHRCAFSYNPTFDYYNQNKICIGSMAMICQYCSAKKWQGESTSLCCSGGKIKLNLCQDPPDELKSLLIGNNPECKNFRKNIIKYNSAFQMTSFGAGKNLTDFNYFTTYRIQGQCYHQMGGLLPHPERHHRYVQVYFMTGGDYREAEQRSRNVHGGLNLDIVIKLQLLLHQHHTYVNAFKYALEHLEINALHKVVIRADKRPPNQHEGRYNVPVNDEIAIIMLDEDHGSRDIVLKHRSDDDLTRIAETHRSYDCLQYPLIFWSGQDGYNFHLRQINPITGIESSKSVSCKDFYAYQLMIRGQSNHILRFNNLTSQFLVDMYAKIETERLGYIKRNQKKLRAEQYIHLRDSINADGNPLDIGQQIILPSSFIGGPRYMHERTMEAMAYVRKFGKPDLFITFTCNPKWIEITRELFENQKPNDRHDLLARVFKQKQQKLIWLLKDGQVFGELNAYMTTIEWQKRGLPHSHTLIWCKQKLRPDDVDNIISAELPDIEEDPILYDIVKSQLIHGPCGALNRASPCMENNRCKKNYPKQLIQNTQTDKDGYPLYRRRGPENGGKTTTLHIRGDNIVVDNRWVVPHCKLLCKILNAHINVEFCSTVRAIIYVTKYINKGCDMATIAISNIDIRNEVAQFQTGRYISSNEAVWRIFGFEIHQRYPTVVNLAVHLENGQRVYFTESTAQQAAQAPPETTLTGFFKLCATDMFAQSLLYAEVPTYYAWSSTERKWKRRKQGKPVETPHHIEGHIKASNAIGRVYAVHPNNRECFYLRLLLHTVRGPTSFEHIRTFDGTVSISNHEACKLHNLLQDDQQWSHTLEEASHTRVASQIRQLFVIMLTSCEIDQPLVLWEKYKISMSEDILHQIRRHNQHPDIVEVYNHALLDLSKRVRSLNTTLTNCGMPEPRGHFENDQEILAETQYDHQLLRSFVEEKEPQLTHDQNHVYRTILNSINNNMGGLFFIDAPGGTGKTFLENVLLAKTRLSHIALAVGSSGIAATLLDGGRTAHSMFKLPLDLNANEQPMCNIKKNSTKGTTLQRCKLIIWDEVTMANKKGLEALDRTLKDLRGNSLIMGGITMVLSGDFRQTLPIIQRGTRADEINACIKTSYLWPQVKRLSLHTNMRVLNGDPNAGEFALQLLQVGNGNIEQNSHGEIELPFGKFLQTQNELIYEVFPNIEVNYSHRIWLSERAILAPKNTAVRDINLKILDMIPGEPRIYKSIDTVNVEEQVVNYPVEFLNSLEPSGIPSHKLLLKLGAPIMLLRNLDPPKLCNGTRLAIKNMLNNIIEATIISGKFAGEICFIPKMPLKPSNLPFEFKRLQFPIKLSFAMTINKSQGQSFKSVGLELTNPVFAHGQLYVGASRVGSPNNLFVLAPDKKTKNIVYPEALV